ncbi:MAG: thiamine-monophosphate kinase [Alphaproteobacteria bacterium]
MNEFSLIKKYFAERSFVRKDVIVGIGDDAAITQVPQSQSLATTTDTLVNGVHFLPNTSAQDIAHKAIAVNLSDLAAMGAEPSWLSLSLTLPDVDEAWLSAFSEKVAELTEYFSLQLIGGDTVKGPLSITITAQGFVPQDSILTRDGAKNGDWIFVTGTLGDAGAGLDILRNKLAIEDVSARDYLVKRHRCPTPRVLAGTVLRRLASACIDVSDGLLQDVMHIATASGTGVIIHLEKLPISEALGSYVKDLHQALDYATSAGDDYELLFTVSEEQRNSVQTALDSYSVQHTCIGQMTGATGKLDLKLNDEPFTLSLAKPLGYAHF